MNPKSILHDLEVFHEKQKKYKIKMKKSLLGILIFGMILVLIGLTLIFTGDLGGIAALLIGGILSLAAGISSSQIGDVNSLVIMADEILKLIPEIESHLHQAEKGGASNLRSLLSDDLRKIQNIINSYEIKHPVYKPDKQKLADIVESPLTQVLATLQSSLQSEQKLSSSIEKVKRLLIISDEVKLDDLQQLLKIGRGELLDLLLNIEDTTLFSITGDILKVKSRQNASDFIDQLDNQFKQWEGNETTKVGKLG
jgi:hypothetical protein